jgi:hypothetical protein
MLPLSPGSARSTAPTAGYAQLDIAPSQTIDLTNLLLALDMPGLPGDFLAITAVGIIGTTGTVAFAAGDATHTGDITYTAPKSGTSDSFTVDDVSRAGCAAEREGVVLEQVRVERDADFSGVAGYPASRR